MPRGHLIKSEQRNAVLQVCIASAILICGTVGNNTTLRIGLSITRITNSSNNSNATVPSHLSVDNAIALFTKTVNNGSLNNFTINNGSNGSTAVRVSFNVTYDDGTNASAVSNYLGLVNHVDVFLGPSNSTFVPAILAMLNTTNVKAPFVCWSTDSWTYFLVPVSSQAIDPVMLERVYHGVSQVGGGVPPRAMIPGIERYAGGPTWHDPDGPMWNNASPTADVRLFDVNVPYTKILANALTTWPGRNSSNSIIILYHEPYVPYASQLIMFAHELKYDPVIPFQLGTSGDTIEESGILTSPNFTRSLVVLLMDDQATCRTVFKFAETGNTPESILTLPLQHALLRSLESHYLFDILEPMVWAPPLGSNRTSAAFGDYATFHDMYNSTYPNSTDLEFEFLGEVQQPDGIGKLGFERQSYKTSPPLAAIQVATAGEVLVSAFVAANGSISNMSDVMVNSGAIYTLLGNVQFTSSGRRFVGPPYNATLTRQWNRLPLVSDPTMYQSGLIYLNANLYVTRESFITPLSTLGGFSDWNEWMKALDASSSQYMRPMKYPMRRWRDKEISTYPCDVGCEWLGYRCKPCNPGTFRDKYRKSCSSCRRGRYTLEDGKSECNECPERGTCPRRSRKPLAKAGYYRLDKPNKVYEVHKLNTSKDLLEYCFYTRYEFPFELLKCPVSTLCLSNNTCKGLNAGLACLSCADDATQFHFLAGLATCEKCPSEFQTYLCLAFSGALYVVLVLVLAVTARQASYNRKAGSLAIVRTMMYNFFLLNAVIEGLNIMGKDGERLAMAMLPTNFVYRPFDIASVRCWFHSGSDGVFKYMEHLLFYSETVIPIGLVGVLVAGQVLFFINNAASAFWQMLRSCCCGKPVKKLHEQQQQGLSLASNPKHSKDPMQESHTSKYRYNPEGRNAFPLPMSHTENADPSHISPLRRSWGSHIATDADTVISAAAKAQGQLATKTDVGSDDNANSGSSMVLGPGALFNRINMALENKLLLADMGSMILAWLLVAYVPIIRTMAILTSCVDSIDGEEVPSYWRMDSSVMCKGDKFENFHWHGKMTMLAHTFAVPAVLFLVLGFYRLRDEFEDLWARRVITVLFDGYTRECWFYQPFVVLRTGLFIVATEQAAKDYQVRLVLGFLVLSICVLTDMLFDPFIDRDCWMLRSMNTFCLMSMWSIAFVAGLEEIWHITFEKMGADQSKWPIGVEDANRWFALFLIVSFLGYAAVCLFYKRIIQELDIAEKSNFLVSDSVMRLVWCARWLWGLNEINLIKANGKLFIDTSKLRELERAALVECIYNVLEGSVRYTSEVKPSVLATLLDEVFEKAVSSRRQGVRQFYTQHGMRPKFMIKCGFQNCFSIIRQPPDIVSPTVSSITVSELQYATADSVADFHPNLTSTEAPETIIEEQQEALKPLVWEDHGVDHLNQDLADAGKLVCLGDVPGRTGMHHLCTTWGHDFKLRGRANLGWQCMNVVMPEGCCAESSETYLGSSYAACVQCGFEICDKCWERMTGYEVQGMEITVLQVKLLHKDASRELQFPFYVRVQTLNKPQEGFKTPSITLEKTYDLDDDSNTWRHTSVLKAFRTGDSIQFYLRSDRPKERRAQQGVVETSFISKLWGQVGSVGVGYSSSSSKVARSHSGYATSDTNEVFGLGPALAMFNPIRAMWGGTPVGEADGDDMDEEVVPVDEGILDFCLGQGMILHSDIDTQRDNQFVDVRLYDPDDSNVAQAVLSVHIKKLVIFKIRNQDPSDVMQQGLDEHEKAKNERIKCLREQIAITQKQIQELTVECHKADSNFGPSRVDGASKIKSGLDSDNVLSARGDDGLLRNPDMYDQETEDVAMLNTAVATDGMWNQQLGRGLSHLESADVVLARREAERLGEDWMEGRTDVNTQGTTITPRADDMYFRYPKISEDKRSPSRVFARLRWGRLEEKHDWVITSPRALPRVKYEFGDACVSKDPAEALERMRAVDFLPVSDEYNDDEMLAGAYELSSPRDWQRLSNGDDHHRRHPTADTFDQHDETAHCEDDRVYNADWQIHLYRDVQGARFGDASFTAEARSVEPHFTSKYLNSLRSVLQINEVRGEADSEHASQASERLTDIPRAMIAASASEASGSAREWDPNAAMESTLAPIPESVSPSLPNSQPPAGTQQGDEWQIQEEMSDDGSRVVQGAPATGMPQQDMPPTAPPTTPRGTAVSANPPPPLPPPNEAPSEIFPSGTPPPMEPKTQGSSRVTTSPPGSATPMFGGRKFDPAVFPATAPRQEAPSEIQAASDGSGAVSPATAPRQEAPSEIQAASDGSGAVSHEDGATTMLGGQAEKPSLPERSDVNWIDQLGDTFRDVAI